MTYTDIDKIILWLSLGLGTGSTVFFDLVDYYGNVEEVWKNFDAKDENLSFLSAKQKATLDKTKNLSYVNNCIRQWNNPEFLTILSDNYPAMLREIINPPILLYYKGEMNAHKKSIAIVGSRTCTRYGLDCAYKFGAELANSSVTIVSGGARGIDSKAHCGALASKGRTVCVFGCGIDVVYPPENSKLFEDIVDNGGALITEYPPGERPNGWHFPERNRIISGMCSGTIVVEAGDKSGALITARMAVDEGREVFCVPGNITSKASSGTNKLIKNGAVLIDDYSDVIYHCGWYEPIKKSEPTIDNYENLDNTEKTIVNEIIKYGEISVDELIEHLEMEISAFNSISTMLEISGVIKRLPGNIFTI